MRDYLRARYRRVTGAMTHCAEPAPTLSRLISLIEPRRPNWSFRGCLPEDFSNHVVDRRLQFFSSNVYDLITFTINTGTVVETKNLFAQNSPMIPIFGIWHGKRYCLTWFCLSCTRQQCRCRLETLSAPLRTQLNKHFHSSTRSDKAARPSRILAHRHSRQIGRSEVVSRNPNGSEGEGGLQYDHRHSQHREHEWLFESRKIDKSFCDET